MFSTEFIDRLVQKNSARNHVEKLTVPHFSPTFISQDGDTSDVCPLIMRLVTQSVTQVSLYKTASGTPQKKFAFSIRSTDCPSCTCKMKANYLWLQAYFKIDGHL